MKIKLSKTGVINDPLGQTHSLGSSEHCFRLKFVLFWKSGDGRTDGRTDKVFSQSRKNTFSKISREVANELQIKKSNWAT